MKNVVTRFVILDCGSEIGTDLLMDDVSVMRITEFRKK
jgi:hypothetical protein